MTKLHQYPSGEIDVTYDAARCIHAAECVLRLRAVFDTSQRPWVQPEQGNADEIAEVIEKCPSGALHYARRGDGLNELADDVNSVSVQRNGPLYIRGELELVAPDGSVTAAETRMALCRCGQSKHKPYCDNSHRAQFEEAGAAGKELAPQTVAATGKLTILPNPNGSLKLSGPCEIRTTDGNVARVERVSLCRCGQSKVKPYCDGTHKETGFRTE